VRPVTGRLQATTGVLDSLLIILFLYCCKLNLRERRNWLAAPHGYTYWYDSARWIRDNTRPDDVVAAYNAGIVGFHSQRRVVNLDGLVNSHDYLRKVIALAGKDKEKSKSNLREFLRTRNVSYFTDLVPNRDENYWPNFFITMNPPIRLHEVYRTSEQTSDFAAVYSVEYVESPTRSP
jgi:hypothetical protein